MELLCSEDRRQKGLYACICQFPLPILCQEHCSKHSLSPHFLLPLDSARKINSAAVYQQEKTRLLRLAANCQVLRDYTDKLSALGEEADRACLELMDLVQKLRSDLRSKIESVKSGFNSQVEAAISACQSNAMNPAWTPKSQLPRYIWTMDTQTFKERKFYDFSVRFERELLEDIVIVDVAFDAEELMQLNISPSDSSVYQIVACQDEEIARLKSEIARFRQEAETEKQEIIEKWTFEHERATDFSRKLNTVLLQGSTTDHSSDSDSVLLVTRLNQAEDSLTAREREINTLMQKIASLERGLPIVESESVANAEEQAEIPTDQSDLDPAQIPKLHKRIRDLERQLTVTSRQAADLEAATSEARKEAERGRKEVLVLNEQLRKAELDLKMEKRRDPNMKYSILNRQFGEQTKELDRVKKRLSECEAERAALGTGDRVPEVDPAAIEQFRKKIHDLEEEKATLVAKSSEIERLATEKLQKKIRDLEDEKVTLTRRSIETERSLREITRSRPAEQEEIRTLSRKIAEFEQEKAVLTLKALEAEKTAREAKVSTNLQTHRDKDQRSSLEGRVRELEAELDRERQENMKKKLENHEMLLALTSERSDKERQKAEFYKQLREVEEEKFEVKRSGRESHRPSDEMAISLPRFTGSLPGFITLEQRRAYESFGSDPNRDEERAISLKGPVEAGGGVYIGQWNDRGERHGYGKFHHPNGDISEGDWQNDERTGRARHFWKNGEVYIGSRAKGKREGYGSHWLPNGSTYHGQWQDDLKHGFGSMQYSDQDAYGYMCYFGEWRSDKKEGRGFMVWRDGAVYVGTWREDRREGKGLQRKAMGLVESGEFLDNTFQGGEGEQSSPRRMSGRGGKR